MRPVYRDVRKVLWVVLSLNWAVAATKMILGKIIGSVSMFADGLHSLSDGVSNIIGLVSVTFANQPADADHPYGHKKYETVATIGIAGVLLGVCVNIVREAAGRFSNPVIPQVSWESLGVMLATMAVNYGVMRYEYHQGKVLQSDFLIADSLHTQSDLLVSVSVFITLIGVKYGYPQADAVISLFIAAAVALAASRIMVNSIRVLGDASVVEPERIRQIVLAVEGVLDCHHIRSRGRPDHIFIDLHILIDKHTSVVDAHTISHRVVDAIKREIPGVVDVIVHIEPYLEWLRRKIFRIRH